MAIVYTAQWQPISNAETQIGAGLSVRYCRDMAETINNDKAHVHNGSLGCHVCSPAIAADTDVANVERWVHSYAASYVPDGYSHIAWVMGHQMTSGSGNTIWRVYSMAAPYKGSANINSDGFVGDYYVSNCVTTNTDHALTPNLRLKIARGSKGLTYIMVTSQSTDGVASKMTVLNRWPTVD